LQPEGALNGHQKSADELLLLARGGRWGSARAEMAGGHWITQHDRTLVS